MRKESIHSDCDWDDVERGSSLDPETEGVLRNAATEGGVADEDLYEKEREGRKKEKQEE